MDRFSGLAREKKVPRKEFVMSRRDHTQDIASQAKQADLHARKQQEALRVENMRAYETAGNHARKAVLEAWKDKHHGRR